MKQHSEKRTEEAVRLLLKTLDQNVTDIGIILDEFESTHDDYELSHSMYYEALGAAHFTMKQAIERINKRLNKLDHD